MAESADNKPNVVVGGVKQKRFNFDTKDPKSWGRLAAIFILLFAIGFGGYAIYLKVEENKNKPTAYTAEQKAALLNKAKANLKIKNAYLLKDVAEEIKKIQGYESDPNYLYVLTYYYAYGGYYDEANTNYVKLSKVYNDQTRFDPTIADKVLSLDSLSSQIKSIKNRAAETQKNSFTVQEPKQ